MKKHLFLLALSFQLRLSTQYQTKEEYDQDTAGLKKIGMCRNWHKANKHTFVEECQPTCGDAKEHSVLCFDISSDGSTKDWHTSYDGEKYTLGHCKCDVAIAEKIVGQYVLWLPVVAEIGCFIFLKTLSWIGELVVNAAIDAIPGGAAVNGALKMVIQAAKTFASNGLPADPFKAWILDTCDVDPNEKWVKDIGGIFDALSGSVVPGIEGVPCKKCPGGKNDNHDIDKDKDKDRGKPTGGPKDPKPTHNDHGQTSRKDEQHKPTPTSDEHKSVAQTSKGSPQSTARSSNPPKSSAVSTAQTPKSSLQSTARSSDPPKSSAASDKIPSDQARTKTDTPASMTATPTSASACALGKRDGQNVRDQNVRYFEDGRNTFFDGCTLHVTTTTKKDWGALTTPAVTCSARWSQACYHYRSVMSVQGALGKTDYVRWTCGATASSFDGRATRLYSTSSLVVKKNENGGVPFFSVPDKLNQHHFGWIDRWVEAGYTTTNYVGGCDRDEWPPRNFWPESKKAKEGQFIRLLPAGENRGAGSMWNGFCKMNSDWKHWLRKDHLSNEKDNDRIRTTNSMVVENIKDGRTTITTSVGVIVPQPVFEIKHWDGLPDGDGLEKNKCVPSVLLDDYGFVLLTNDPWYDRPENAHHKATVGIYARPPPEMLMAGLQPLRDRIGEKEYCQVKYAQLRDPTKPQKNWPKACYYFGIGPPRPQVRRVHARDILPWRNSTDDMQNFDDIYSSDEDEWEDPDQFEELDAGAWDSYAEEEYPYASSPASAPAEATVAPQSSTELETKVMARSPISPGMPQTTS